MKLELRQNTKNIVIYGGKKEMMLLLIYFLHKKLKIRFSYSIDFFITKLINFFI